MTSAQMRAPAHEPHGKPQLNARVLIEEPNVDVRGLIVALVTDLGCEPLVRPPLDDCSLDDVDLIIAEPASVGAQRIFAAHGRSQSRIPILCLSIYPRERASLPRPVVAYLVKPFSPSKLQTAIRSACESSPYRR